MAVIILFLAHPFLAAGLRFEINNRWISRAYENTAQPIIDSIPDNGFYKHNYTGYLVWLCGQYSEKCTVTPAPDMHLNID
ncbi:hypothetical protein [Thalassolituus hydrocarboniclasticus]|uniref:Uncharacterized protein n=1 Tax=Thalassolituus hydrocarboniclasticus TaxID=2742796 RepID=A0ABY6ADI9_9GAMM|nr:hypothetical protein [Thalassolituus hydrocarboniclasticus]UXD88346.1 hypothetical protein HUF19_13335 [Thalassolituus hydrocarboniclasticus]